MFKLDAATQPSSARKVRTRPVDARRSEMPEEVGEDHDVAASIPEQLLVDKVLCISDDHSLTTCPSPLQTIVANHQELTGHRNRTTSRYPGESDSSRFDVALTHQPWYRACSSRVSSGWRVASVRCANIPTCLTRPGTGTGYRWWCRVRGHARVSATLLRVKIGRLGRYGWASSWDGTAWLGCSPCRVRIPDRCPRNRVSPNQLWS
jgi:hypothetical protein